MPDGATRLGKSVLSAESCGAWFGFRRDRTTCSGQRGWSVASLADSLLGRGGPGCADGCGWLRSQSRPRVFAVVHGRNDRGRCGVYSLSIGVPDAGLLSLHSCEVCYLPVLVLTSRVCTQQGSHLLYVCHIAVIIVILISKLLYLTDSPICMSPHATGHAALDGTITQLFHPRIPGIPTEAVRYHRIRV